MCVTFHLAGNREVLDFPNDAANDVGSPPPAVVNGVEERPILDEMIARMQQEQDERAGAASSSSHQPRSRNADRRDQATATGDNFDFVIPKHDVLCVLIVV